MVSGILCIAQSHATQEVYWLHDRVKNHSFLHGKDVAIKYWMHQKLKAIAALNPDRPKRLSERDLCFISIECNPDDQKIAEWFDVPVDSANPWACVPSFNVRSCPVNFFDYPELSLCYLNFTQGVQCFALLLMF